MDTTRARSPGPGRPRLAPLALAGLLTAGAVTLLLASTLLPGRPEPVADLTGEHRPPELPGAAAHRDQGFAFWGSDHRGGPLRWDACAPVRFVLSSVDAPEHAERDLSTALALLSDASGLDLVLLGTTEERPQRSRALVEPDGPGWRWRPVLVAWAAPGETDMPLDPLDRGVALPVAVRVGDREGFVTGQVVLNARRTDLMPGFEDRRDAIGATLLHELGHVLGLAHVDDARQLMAEAPGSGPVVLGDGDRAGLQAIGAGDGCTPAPPATSGRGLVVAP
jgi:hypothetical protein